MEKLLKLDKYAPRLVEAHTVLKKEKYFYEAEITLLAKNLRAFGQGRSKENIFTAIDQAYSRVEKQLKKFRERIKDHHKKRRSPGEIPESVEALEGIGEILPRSSEGPAIVRSPSFAPKPMSIEEASLQLGLSSESFLVFLNPSNQRVNVVFKRADGNHGLIEPIV